MSRKETKKIKPVREIIASVIISLITTSLSYFRLPSTVKNLEGWAFGAIILAIFLFVFALAMALHHIQDVKKAFKRINRYTLFLILSMIMSAMVNWITYQREGFWQALYSFSLGTGICFAVFTIFYKFDYAMIEKSFVQLFKNVFLYILLPSMFLVIALMGKIDSTGSYLTSVKENLYNACYQLAGAFYKLIEVIYNLGKYQYSIAFIVAIFVFLCFYALWDFFKKTREDGGKDE